MKASEKVGSFLSSTNLISPSPVTKVYSYTVNRVLTSNYGGQPKAVVIACIVLGIPGTLVINNSKLGISDLAVGFDVVSCGSWGEYYLLSSAASIYLCSVRKKHVCMRLKLIKYIHFCMTFPNILSVNYSSFLRKGVLTIFNSKWENQQKNKWELKLPKIKWKGKKAEIWKRI